MKSRIYKILQKMGRSFMVPIAVLPIAGLFLGIGTVMTTDSVIQSLNLESVLKTGTILNGFFVVLMQVGNTIFDNLPIIFAISVAAGFAKKSKEIAVLSVVIAFFVMHSSISALLTLDGTIVNNQVVDPNVLVGTITYVCGILSLQMGVFGGILVGLGVSYLHNRYYKIQLPTYLSFFEGERFVPIISTVVFLFVGLVVYFVWPVVQNGIFYLGNIVASSGYLGTFGYGIIKRALIPFGLHHVFYLPFWQTALGGSMLVDGVMVQGAQNIFFAQLSDPSVVHFSSEVTRYFTGEFIFMIFGLPGAALAMYHTADSQNKKKVASLLITATLTCVLTGITEPIEFLFLFAAPMLFGVQVILAGSAYMIAHIFNIAIGLTFSGGLIDFIVFGVIQGNDKTSWLTLIPIGIIYFILYYVIFRLLIQKFNLKTPGRLDNQITVFKDIELLRNFNTDQIDVKSQLLVRGLGGRDNFDDYDCCITRLRAEIKDTTKINESILKQSGAAAVVLHGNTIQIIYGPKASTIKTNLSEYLAKVPSEYDDYQADEGKKLSDSVVLTGMVEGEVLPIEEANDEIFSRKLLGDGIMIKPYNGLITAPCSAYITMVYPTKHALGLKLDNGCEVLIHFGIETVQLNGQGFELLVQSNQRVEENDPLWNVDLDYIRKNAVSENILLVVTSSSNQYKLKKKYGEIDRKSMMLEIDS